MLHPEPNTRERKRERVLEIREEDDDDAYPKLESLGITF